MGCGRRMGQLTCRCCLWRVLVESLCEGELGIVVHLDIFLCEHVEYFFGLDLI